MITFMIQARVGSTRLPNKILLPFYENKCILQLLLDKLKQVEGTNIVIATSKDPQNDAIEALAKQEGVCCFRGEENDVLQRFIDAAHAFDAERLIRICSDNPFLELHSIRQLVEKARQSNCDYMSFNINGTPSIKTHYGFWTEYVTCNALECVKNTTQEPLYHEHVTNYIYSHPNEFSIEWLDGPAVLDTHSHVRLTTDTRSDFETAQQVYSALCSKNPYPSIAEVIDFLDHHPAFYQQMEAQIKQNSK
ncbi:cytidylyltransferase domain-containing protein [Segatella oulorum]|uniref:cytidylyltransferase domain-containing protein n=1 Tax=Segatella oulorum TaxID=28136 RepID=UPI0023F4ACB9|nr:NTP transferase domain-containing protein [Segatella oulorum]